MCNIFLYLRKFLTKEVLRHLICAGLGICLLAHPGTVCACMNAALFQWCVVNSTSQVDALDDFRGDLSPELIELVRSAQPEKSPPLSIHPSLVLLHDREGVHPGLTLAIQSSYHPVCLFLRENIASDHASYIYSREEISFWFGDRAGDTYTVFLVEQDFMYEIPQELTVEELGFAAGLGFGLLFKNREGGSSYFPYKHSSIGGGVNLLGSVSYLLNLEKGIFRNISMTGTIRLGFYRNLNYQMMSVGIDFPIQ